MAEQDRWGVIYSTSPSLFKGHKRWMQIRRYLDSKGVAYDFVQSEAVGSVERLAGMLCQNGYRTIVLVGDDGALYDAINGIMSHVDVLPADFAFGLIPYGIGHDFARFWSISSDDYEDAVDRLIARRTRKIDVGYISYQKDGVEQKRYFLNCINIGLGARLIKTTNDFLRITKSSLLSVIPVFVRHLFERKSVKLKFQIETEVVDGSFMSVCIGNGLGYGQTPNAVPYNGMIDVSTVTRPLWWQMFEGFWLLGKGRFLNYKNVHPYRAQKVLVSDIGKAFLTLDGRELKEKNPTPFEVGVESEVIEFVV